MATKSCGYNNGRNEFINDRWWWIWRDCKSGQIRMERLYGGSSKFRGTPVRQVSESVQLNTGMGKTVRVPRQSRTGRLIRAGILR